MQHTTFDTKRWGRWVGTFIAFPVAGLAARAVAGNIDTTTSALIGGLAGGAVLGGVQALITGMSATERTRWIGGTAVGLSLGLAAGASAAGFETDTASLAAMGAISGAGVGLAQALAMVPARRVDRLAWALATPLLWAGAWAITSQVIVDADRQHAVFGSSGALVVGVVAGVLHALRGPVVVAEEEAPAATAGPLAGRRPVPVR
jgi:hypothetical protein